MNFDKGYNVFSDIPGFDASKGERILKALQRLWKKIERLEQIRNSERKYRSKEVPTSPIDADLTITDVQYKLLILQLQYVRSVLRKRVDKSNKSHSEMLENDNITRINSKKITDHQRTTVIQETQRSLGKEQSPKENYESVNEVGVQVISDNKIFRSEGLVNNSKSVAAKNLHSSSVVPSKPHYHLKLDDVPFILGASSTASHSVVANLQNVIARMKCHSKALCGPKHISKEHAVKTAEGSQDTSKMINQLSKELYELTLKQEKLAKRFDAAQENRQNSNLTQEDRRKINKPPRRKIFAGDGRRCRSNSESSIKLDAEMKNSNMRQSDAPKHNALQKQNSVRSRPVNLPIMARRKLLRSLQNFKAHLSEDDISWD